MIYLKLIEWLEKNNKKMPKIDVFPQPFYQYYRYGKLETRR